MCLSFLVPGWFEPNGFSTLMSLVRWNSSQQWRPWVAPEAVSKWRPSGVPVASKKSSQKKTGQKNLFFSPASYSDSLKTGYFWSFLKSFFKAFQAYSVLEKCHIGFSLKFEAKWLVNTWKSTSNSIQTTWLSGRTGKKLLFNRLEWQPGTRENDSISSNDRELDLQSHVMMAVASAWNRVKTTWLSGQMIEKLIFNLT